MTPEEKREARRKFYAGEPAAPSAPQVSYPPCRRTASWAARIAQFAEVVLSPPVPDSVFALRQLKCSACPHRQEKGGAFFCGCCGCPKWRLSTLDFKNRLSLWECPIGEFGPADPA